ncbi:unnamed protein product, partial [Rotaria sp. Silwood2]
SNLKWYSADQLQQDNRLITKQRAKRKQQQQQTSDSTTDTGSSFKKLKAHIFFITVMLHRTIYKKKLLF